MDWYGWVMLGCLVLGAMIGYAAHGYRHALKRDYTKEAREPYRHIWASRGLSDRRAGYPRFISTEPWIQEFYDIGYYGADRSTTP